MGLQRLWDADVRVKDIFDDEFAEQNYSFSCKYAGVYIQLLVFKVGSSNGGSLLPSGLPLIFETLLFLHAICNVERQQRSKILLAPVTYKIGMAFEFIMGSISTAWRNAMQNGKLGTWRICIQLHLLYYGAVAKLQVLRTDSDAVSSTTPRDRFLRVNEPNNTVDAVSLECYSCSESLDKAPREVT